MMNEQTINMILQLAEQGGSMALWMYFSTQIVSLIKMAMLLGSGLWLAFKVCKVCRISYEVEDRQNKMNHEQYFGTKGG